MRRLGRFELAQVLTDRMAPLNAVVAVRLRRGPEPPLIEDAARAAGRRHPLLGVRIVESGAVLAFDPEGVPEVPVTAIERQGEEHWKAVAEEELNRRFDLSRGPLLRLSYLWPSSGEESDLVLSFQHAVMDATSGVRLVGELLRRCAGELGGGDRRPVPPPVETLFPPPFRGPRRLAKLVSFAARAMAGEVVGRWGSRGRNLPPVRLDAGNRILTFAMTREETGSLVRRSRRCRVPLASVLGAAVQLAVARRYPGRGRRPALRSVIFPDLRPYLRPAPEDEDLTCCFALVRTVTRFDPARGVWDLARQLGEETRRALSRGDKFAAALLSPLLMRAALRSRGRRMAETALSYTGSLGLAADYGRTALDGLHAFVSNVPIGPVFTASARLDRGELVWDAVYLDTDLDRGEACELAGEIRDLLTET